MKKDRTFENCIIGIMNEIPTKTEAMLITAPPELWEFMDTPYLADSEFRQDRQGFPSEPGSYKGNVELWWDGDKYDPAIELVFVDWKKLN